MTALAWRRLPRDTRDTLFLLAVIAWTVLPHAPQLPGWTTALVAGVLLWRGWIALAARKLPPRWVLIGVLVTVGVLTWWSHRTLLGKEAGVTLVVAMMALKTLELRARRDAFVVFFLGFFIVLTQFFQSQSLLVAAAMLVSVWGLLTALVLAHMPVGQPSLKQAGALAARTAMLGAPVMVVLFLLFPRIGPLWAVQQDMGGKTGLGNTMTLGSVAELALDDTIALRMRFDGPPPPPSAMYLRGPVLSSFDGRQWTRLESKFPAALRPPAELRVEGPPLGYEMTLEPQRQATLPLLEVAPDTPTGTPRIDGYRVTRRDDLQWQTDRPVTDRLRLRAQAHLSFRHGPSEPVVGLQDYVELPVGYNPRTLAWAAELRRRPGLAAADARTLAAAVLQHIRANPYAYTLEPGTYGDAQGRHAIDEFWLDRRQGFCEHYAAAFVVVLRALDIPARIVTGYQGADAEQQDGYVVVRNSAAHAWAEFWQPGEGWVRADPTGAVSPDRIGMSRRLAPQPGFVAGAIATLNPNLMLNLRAFWEASNNRWNQAVLNYARNQQLDLLKRLGFSAPTWQDLGYLLVLLISGTSLAGALWAWWDRQRQDPWMRLAAEARRTLAEVGVASAPHHPPLTLARALRRRYGEAADAAARQLEALDAARYGPAAQRRPPAGWRRAFASALAPLRAGTSPVPPGTTR